jgi:pimeloyl-ACP methyl ester carboxylesterase
MPPFVEAAGGHRLFVRDWGAGPPVVLLAGWALDSRTWGETMLELNSHGLRTIAYDRRGHGRSTDPGAADYDSLADDLGAVLDSLDLTGVTLVCHSGAGGEAIRYTSRRGAARLARIVLVGATGPKMMTDADDPLGATIEMVDALMTQLTTDLAGWIDANAAPFAPGAPGRVIGWMSTMMLDCSRRILLDFQRAIVVADLRDEARSLPVPVTIIHGDQDVSAPIDLTARRYAELIPDVELVIYEGAAHGLMVTHAQRLGTDIARRVHSKA